MKSAYYVFRCAYVNSRYLFEAELREIQILDREPDGLRAFRRCAQQRLNCGQKILDRAARVNGLVAVGCPHDQAYASLGSSVGAAIPFATASVDGRGERRGF